MTTILPLLYLILSFHTADISVQFGRYDLEFANILPEEFLSVHNQNLKSKSLQIAQSSTSIWNENGNIIIIKASRKKRIRDNDHQKTAVVITPNAKKRLVVKNQAPKDKEQASISQQLIDNEEISSGFGKRTDPLNNGEKFHKGIDISRPTGTEVFAWEDGVVTQSGWLRGYGLTVDVVHPNGIKTRYAHLKLANVRKGQKISKGKILGRVGETGRTTGANLHFEVIIAGKLADPLDHLSKENEIVGNGTGLMNNG